MAFKDFIPEDDMAGQPIGVDGYQDFVPTPKPVKREVEEVKPEPKVVKPKGRPAGGKKKK